MLLKAEMEITTQPQFIGFVLNPLFQKKTITKRTDRIPYANPNCFLRSNEEYTTEYKVPNPIIKESTPKYQKLGKNDASKTIGAKINHINPCRTSVGSES